jgi:PAS domain S-box-containing protein
MKLDGIGINPFAVLEAASESILVTEADMEWPGPIIVYVNPTFERMTGWTAGEVVGKSPRILQGTNTDLSIFLGMQETLRVRTETHEARANRRVRSMTEAA